MRDCGGAGGELGGGREREVEEGREVLTAGPPGGRSLPLGGALEGGDDEFVAGFDVDAAAGEGAGEGVGDGFAVGVEFGDLELADDAEVAADGELGALLGIVGALNVQNGEAVLGRIACDGGDKEGFLNDAGAAAFLVGFFDIALGEQDLLLLEDVGFLGDVFGIVGGFGEFCFEGFDAGGVLGLAVGFLDGVGGEGGGVGSDRGGDGGGGMAEEGDLAFGGFNFGELSPQLRNFLRVGAGVHGSDGEDQGGDEEQAGRAKEDRHHVHGRKDGIFVGKVKRQWKGARGAVGTL